MRKTLAFFVSLFSLYVFGLATLHPIYRTLADWLGPVMGSHIYTFFTFIYLLLADPRRYPMVALVWIFLGILIGVISGKKLGAAITALLVWITTLLLLASSMAGAYLRLEATGVFTEEAANIAAIMPVVPEGITLNTLLQAPILNDLVRRLIDLAPRITSIDDPTAIMRDAARPYLFYAASKPVILITCAIIGATISEEVFTSTRRLFAGRKTVEVALLIAILLLQPSSEVYALNLGDGVYAEALGGYIDEQNRAVMGEVLLGTQVMAFPLDTLGASGLVASIVATYRISDPSILYAVGPDEASDYLGLISLLPSTVAVNIYLGSDIEDIEARSSLVAQTIESSLQLDLIHILTIPIPASEQSSLSTSDMTAVVYISLNSFEETMDRVIEPFVGEGGFAQVFEEKRSDETCLDVEVYLSGVVSLEPFAGMLESHISFWYQEEYEALRENRVSFLIGLQASDEAAQRVGDSYRFDMMETLDIGSPLSYADRSDISFIILARSNRTDVANQYAPSIHIKTSLPENSQELGLLTRLIQDRGTFEVEGGPPTDLDTTLIIEGVHLPMVSLMKKSQRINNMVEVTITATNNGDQPLTNLTLTDRFPRVYGELVEGSGNANWTHLGSGQSRTLSYKLRVKNPGKYIDTPAVLRYSLGGSRIPTTSNVNPVIEKPPNPVSMLADSYQASTEVLDLVFDGGGDLLGFAVLGVVLLVVFIDVIKYLSWRTRRGETP